MTDAELAILSIVAEGPIYGYDIQTIITQRALRVWTNIGVSSMYYVMEKLEQQGLIESKGAQHVQGPARRQYQITPAGYGVMQTAVADLLSTPREYASGVELGLANLHVLRPSQIRTALITYQQELASRLAQTRERLRQLASNQPPFNVDAMFEHRLAMLEAELKWIDDFINRWEAQVPAEEADAHLPEPLEIPRMKQVVLPRDPDSPHRMPTRPLNVSPELRPTPPADQPSDAPIPPSLKATAPSNSTPPDLKVNRKKDADEEQ
jgi:DNA-binding PadR family transcriptional regulator